MPDRFVRALIAWAASLALCFAVGCGEDEDVHVTESPVGTWRRATEASVEWTVQFQEGGGWFQTRARLDSGRCEEADGLWTVEGDSLRLVEGGDVRMLAWERDGSQLLLVDPATGEDLVHEAVGLMPDCASYEFVDPIDGIWSGLFRASIDGGSSSFDARIVVVADGGELSIEGVGSEGLIRFQLSGTVQGEYLLLGNGSCHYWPDFDEPGDWYSTTGPGVGLLTLTTVTDTLIRGSFSATLRNLSGTRIVEVVDGELDISAE